VGLLFEVAKMSWVMCTAMGKKWPFFGHLLFFSLRDKVPNTDLHCPPNAWYHYGQSHIQVSIFSPKFIRNFSDICRVHGGVHICRFLVRPWHK
jgi:hypothetical protein